VAEALSPEQALVELASVSLELTLASRLTEAATALHAHLDRIGAVVGALHATGRRGRGSTGSPPDRAGGSAPVRAALAELFEPERELLRLSPEQAALVFLGLLFASANRPPSPSPSSSRSSPSPSADEPRVTLDELVDLFLHGALSASVR
jgi:hypothetical protein